jgi:putative glycosyltransferase (TIGR04348 family)
MRFFIATPAAAGSLSGNRRTALRYAAILRELGHRARVGMRWRGEPCDALIALHARKSAPSVRAFRAARPRAPVVLVLTGTDLYGHLRRRGARLPALDLADRIVVLQPAGLEALPARVRGRARAILQSARPPGRPARKVRGAFQACVLGHLRPVKDPFRAALAARRLPAPSRIRVVHAGAALSPGMAARARAEEARNPRYRWLGPLSHARALALLARSQVLIQSSLSEGGAIAMSEALVCGVPILSSNIPGATGMLGIGHPGLFPVRDTRRLAGLMLRAEHDARFHARLRRAGERIVGRFAPSREREAWRDLVAGLPPPGGSHGA